MNFDVQINPPRVATAPIVLPAGFSPPEGHAERMARGDAVFAYVDERLSVLKPGRGDWHVVSGGDGMRDAPPAVLVGDDGEITVTLHIMVTSHGGPAWNVVVVKAAIFQPIEIFHQTGDTGDQGRAAAVVALLNRACN